MFEKLRRLYQRGPDSRGLTVDAEGAVLGPDCVLVRRTSAGYATADRGEIAIVQRIDYGDGRQADWLFNQCRLIARALSDNQIAFAQIQGVLSCPDDLDDRQIQRLGEAALLCKANFNPDEPRVPAGNPDGGEWTTEDGGPELEVAANQPDRKSICIERCAHLLERPLPYRWSDLNTFAFHRCVNDCMRESEVES